MKIVNRPHDCVNAVKARMVAQPKKWTLVLFYLEYDLILWAISNTWRADCVIFDENLISMVEQIPSRHGEVTVRFCIAVLTFTVNFYHIFSQSHFFTFTLCNIHREHFILWDSHSQWISIKFWGLKFEHSFGEIIGMIKKDLEDDSKSKFQPKIW